MPTPNVYIGLRNPRGMQTYCKYAAKDGEPQKNEKK
jgi:hypothetical protein